MRRLQATWLVLFCFTFGARSADDRPCPSADVAVTKPGAVDLVTLTDAALALRDTDGKPIVADADGLRSDLIDVFGTDRVTTKMEQFYTLLFSLAARAQPATVPRFLDPADVRKILLTAAVFTDPVVPAQIAAVSLARKKGDPTYTLSFQGEKTEIPLNGGQGFHLYRNGLCQHAQKLIFGRSFGVTLSKTKKGNTVAKDFRGVDLFGVFGNRGVIDVDIRYVALRAVEFFRGTTDGRVTAYVSDEEFKKHDHSMLLRLVTKYVPDKSVQPIDW